MSEIILDGAKMRQLIIEECDALKDLLLKKNEAYGNSIAEPINLFARGMPRRAQIAVRIDDKLSRISRGKNTEAVPEDTKRDLLGYLLLDLAIERGEREAVKKSLETVSGKHHALGLIPDSHDFRPRPKPRDPDL